MVDKIIGGEIMVIGDLHISDKPYGRHKDYYANCIRVLRELTEQMNKRKPSAIILAGDVIGNTSANLKKSEHVSEVFSYFSKWLSMCPVYAVRGNHDMAACFTGFELFRDLNCFVTSEQLALVNKCNKGWVDVIKEKYDGCNSTENGLDMLAEEKLEKLSNAKDVGYIDYYLTQEHADANEVDTRFHLVDYNNEHTPLHICETESASNVVIGHKAYEIEGLTTWFRDDTGVELSSLDNFNGVDLVVAGHIHLPSTEVLDVDLPNNERCGLFYLGCATQPNYIKNQMYESVWLMYFGKQEGVDLRVPGVVDVDIVSFDQPPVAETFDLSHLDLTEQTEEELNESERKKLLYDTLESTLQYTVTQVDVLDQLQHIELATERAKDLAAYYVLAAQNDSEVTLEDQLEIKSEVVEKEKE